LIELDLILKRALIELDRLVPKLAPDVIFMLHGGHHVLEVLPLSVTTLLHHFDGGTHT